LQAVSGAVSPHAIVTPSHLISPPSHP
jgi:hypothetical protein